MGVIDRLFGKKKAVPVEPFHDEVFGLFTFDPVLGWKKTIILGSEQVEVILGSDGPPPPPAMVAMARAWVTQWNERRPALIAYLAEQTKGWPETNGVYVNGFVVASINFLWENEPETCMIYLDDPHDDMLMWHITCRQLEPVGVAYDD